MKKTESCYPFKELVVERSVNDDKVLEKGNRINIIDRPVHCVGTPLIMVADDL